MLESPCSCPICSWEGWLWSVAESRPGVYVRKVCPNCGSYPRDRIVWQLLHPRRNGSSGTPLSVVEVGESGRAYLWKRRAFNYCNADIAPHHLGYVDMRIEDLGVSRRRTAIVERQPWTRVEQAAPPQESDIALVSYVLSAMRSDRQRLDLLRKLHRATAKTGTLILFDDFKLDDESHRRLRAGDFFHRVRLGNSILALMARAAWQPEIVESYADARILAQLELPFIIAAKA
jgi:hypothetical protein